MLPLPWLAGLPSFARLTGLPAFTALAPLAALAWLPRLAGLSWLAGLSRLARPPRLELMRFVHHGIVIDICTKSCYGDHDGHSCGHCENYQQCPLE